MKPIILLSLLIMSADAASASPIAHQLYRADGTTIHYTLDAPSGESFGLVVLAQGSGCHPAASNANLATVRSAFPQHTALIVEKSGIAPDSPVQHGDMDCPAAFLETYTLSQRIDDYEIVLAHLGSSTPHQTVILFGGSEGGVAMEALAARIHPAAAIILSGSVGGTFGDMVLSTVPPEGRATMAARFDQARANPDGTIMSGHTFLFWADILDHRSSDYLMATDTPFLLIYGGRDQAAGNPVRALADQFAQAGRCNMAYLEFPGLDHRMADVTGHSHMPQVARLAASWAQDPVPTC